MEGCLTAIHLQVVISWHELQTQPSNAKDDRSHNEIADSVLFLFSIQISQTTTPICTNFGGHVDPWVFQLLTKIQLNRTPFDHPNNSSIKTALL